MEAFQISTTTKRVSESIVPACLIFLAHQLKQDLVDAVLRQLGSKNETQMTTVTPLFRNYTEDRFIWEGGSFPYEEPNHQEGHEFYEKVIIIAPLVGAVFLLMLVAAGVYVLRHYDNETNEDDASPKQRKTRKYRSVLDFLYQAKAQERQEEVKTRSSSLNHVSERLLLTSLRTKLYAFCKRLTGSRKIGVESTLIITPGRPQLVQRLFGCDTPESLV